MEKEFLNSLISFRKELHKFPELSNNEFETKYRIDQFLVSCGVPSGKEVGDTGLLYCFDSGNPGPVILLRADIDAIQVQEINEVPHASVIDHVGHMCGHDGHTAILCGVAIDLVQTPPVKGKICLLFQPAEENGTGARAVLNDPAFTIQPDFVFALHNLPGVPLHTVTIKKGTMTSAVRSVAIKLTGKTSHAAEPENGSNPALAMAELIGSFNHIHLRNEEESLATTLVTPVYAKLGSTAYGVSAGEGELHYTLRAPDNILMLRLSQEIEEIVQQICSKHQLEYVMHYMEEFNAVCNDDQAVDYLLKTANVLDIQTITLDKPFRWGEDFGEFTCQYRGALFGLGAGVACAALHNPDYDFPDALLPVGVKLFTSLIKMIQ